MSWFQGVDKSWYNADSIESFKIRCLGGKFRVFADNNMISDEFPSEEEAQEAVDEFMGVIILGQRVPKYWLLKEAKPQRVVQRRCTRCNTFTLLARCPSCGAQVVEVIVNRENPPGADVPSQTASDA